MRRTRSASPNQVAFHRVPRRSRYGFTLAELIVAVMLITVGLGALASTSTWVVSEARASRRTERAANIAQMRLELLRLGPCASATGELSHGDLVERWSVSATANGATAVVSVSPSRAGTVRDQRYQTAFPC